MKASRNTIFARVSNLLGFHSHKIWATISKHEQLRYIFKIKFGNLNGTYFLGD